MKKFGEGGEFGNSTSIVRSYMEYFGFEKRPFFIRPIRSSSSSQTRTGKLSITSSTAFTKAWASS